MEPFLCPELTGAYVPFIEDKLINMSSIGTSFNIRFMQGSVYTGSIVLSSKYIKTLFYISVISLKSLIAGTLFSLPFSDDKFGGGRLSSILGERLLLSTSLSVSFNCPKDSTEVPPEGSTLSPMNVAGLSSSSDTSLSESSSRNRLLTDPVSLCFKNEALVAPSLCTWFVVNVLVPVPFPMFLKI